MGLGFTSGNEISWYTILGSATTSVTIPSASYPSNGTWNFIVVSRTDSVTKIYLNGTEMDSQIDRNTYNAAAVSGTGGSHVATIGRFYPPEDEKYFSGQINFLNAAALDPSAEISVSFEENQIISFDQKFLMGTYMKYDFGKNNYLAGGIFYYNQSIAEEKVDIGYEPMRNFAWNIKGKYQTELDFLTRAIDYMPLINTNKVSKFKQDKNV